MGASSLQGILLQGILLSAGLCSLQDSTWSSLLEQGKYEQAGQALAKVHIKTSWEDLGSHGLGLLRLDLPRARLVLRGLSRAGAGRGKVAALLIDLIAAHRGDPLPLLPRIERFLEVQTYRSTVLPFVGRGALQLCRSGRNEGAILLKRVLALYPGADWAMSNLANGYRFLGQYDQATQFFERLLEQHGRQAWFLNGLALVYQARFDYERALSLFLEAGDERSPGNQADRFTARTNAAILLISRQGKGDLDRAEQLLELVVSKDPVALRAPYYLNRIQRLRGISPGR